jgi:CRISPR type IV-associated protein Csf2
MQKQAKKFIIAVDITTTAPLHITAIEKGAYDPVTQKLVRFDGSGLGTSLTRTQAMAHSPQVLESGTVITPLVPVIPASTVAGKLRRAAGMLIAQSLVGRSLKISPDAYNVLMSGMANTELKADDKIPEVLRAARNEPFLSLFGGTSFVLSAHSVIAEGWPLLASTQACLMSEPIADVQPYNSVFDMTEVLPIVRKNDVADMKDAILEKVVGIDELAAYVDGQGTMRADSKAKKASGDEGKKTDLRALNGVEVVKTGVNFALRIEVTAFAESHLGLMLLAVQSFMRDAQVGGKAARGFGRFVVSGSRLYEVEPDSRTKSVVASLFESKDSGYAFAANGTVDNAVTAAQDYLDEIKPEMLEAFTRADAKALKALVKEAA